MSVRAVRHLYVAELRAALRERTILVNSILMPTLLYPVMLWVIFNGMIFIQGQAERLDSRVELAGLPSAHAEIEELLAGAPGIRLVSEADDDHDVRLIVEPASSGLADDFSARIELDSSRERGRLAGDRVRTIVASYREVWLAKSAGEYLGSAAWIDYRLDPTNDASGDQMGAMILGLMLPIYFVVMVALGCIYPAIDTTAGERERGTWETTLTLATSRTSIVTAKYLVVTTLGFVAGVLNLGAMAASLGTVLSAMIGDSDEVAFSVPLAAVPLLLLGSLLLAASVSICMMLLAAFARDFKEGQAMTAPVYMLTFLPLIFLLRDDLEFSISIALLPTVNVAMMVREAVRGSYPLLPIAVTLLTQTVLIGLLLRLAAAVLRIEDVLTGSYDGSLFAFARRRIFRPKAVSS